MYSLFWSKVAVHPASHSWLMDSKEPDASELKMCVRLAYSGSWGISSRAVCVDCIVSALGSWTVMRLVVGVTLVSGIVVWM